MLISMQTKIEKALRSAALGLLLSVGIIHLAWAVIATYQQIVDAVRNSPNSNAFLVANAAAVANLALRVENRSGDTTNYNGSCCSGILQMNATNIAAFAHVTPAVYRTWSLQAQIDAWTALTVSALGASSVSQLRAMSTFDGMPTDAYMQLSCIQMGIGNCQTMINSGRCEGWRDSNGTSICRMAAGMQGLTYTPGTGTGTPIPATTPTPSSTSGSNNSAFIPTPGNYVPVGSSVSAMLDASFTNGSGVSMASVNTLIKTILASILVAFAIKASIGAWSQYQAGQMETFDLKHGGKRILILMVLMMMVFVY